MTKHLCLSPDLALPPEAVTQTFAILAKRGVGKTYTALVLVEELLGAGAQVVIADPVGVTWGLRAAANGKDAGLPIIVMGGDHGDVPLEASAGKVVAEFVVDTRSSVVLDLSLLRKGDQVRFMTDFAETLYHRNRQPLHLVLDEADAFAPQRPLPDQARMLGAIQDLVRRGRARGIGVTLVTQRAAVLSKDVLTQVEVLVALRTIAPQDRTAIDAWIQAHDAHGQREEFMASLASLPIGTAWFWSPGWLDVFKRVKVRARTTFDSSATPAVGNKAVAPKQLAAVDLEALKGRIAATIEKAKTEDPKALRARIAQLETENRKLTSAKPAAAAAPAPKRVEVPVLKDAQVARVERLGERLEALGRRFTEAAGAVTKAGLDLRDEVRTVGENQLRRLQAPSAPAQHAAARPSMPRHVGARLAPTTHAATGPAADLPKGERAVLTAAAQHDAGVTREQLTVLTGYKRSSRDTYVQRLRERGLLEAQGEQLVATQTGVDALGAGFEPLPTGDALLQHWLRELPEGERRVLEVVVRAYPKAVDREAISEATDYKRSSRDTYLQRLGARRLVVADRDGVRASEELFGMRGVSTSARGGRP